MGRIHAPEIEDEPWFPTRLRDGLTAFLNVSAEKLGVFHGAAPVLQGLLDRHAGRGAPRRIVDLCSGGGGPLVALLENEADLATVEAVLTDLYPNVPAFESAEGRLRERLVGRRDSVDATAVPPSLEGVRTVFNALHHFRPEGARKIFADAAARKQPVVAFELVERHPLTVATILFVPLAVLALVPFSRPDWFRLLFTYVIPIIPVLTGWDGIASCLRAYNDDELRALVADIHVEGYRFTIGHSRRAVFPPLRVTWLVGEPYSE